MTDAMLMIAPASRDRNGGNAARVNRMGAVTLSAMVDAASAADMATVAPSLPLPALFTSREILKLVARTCSTCARPASWVRSASTASTLAPWACNSLAESARKRSARRATRTRS